MRAAPFLLAAADSTSPEESPSIVVTTYLASSILMTAVRTRRGRRWDKPHPTRSSRARARARERYGEAGGMCCIRQRRCALWLAGLDQAGQAAGEADAVVLGDEDAGDAFDGGDEVEGAGDVVGRLDEVGGPGGGGVG